MDRSNDQTRLFFGKNTLHPMMAHCCWCLEQYHGTLAYLATTAIKYMQFIEVYLDLVFDGVGIASAFVAS